MEFKEILEFTASPVVLYSFIALIIVSYFLVALFTWSFTKPLKYLGTSSLVAGFALLATRILLSSINLYEGEMQQVITTLIDYGFKTITNFAIYFIIAGVVSIAGYIVVNKVTKANKEALVTPENINS